jgi:dipeptidyl aminopeptidase/acylaminoacyl peptidase
VRYANANAPPGLLVHGLDDRRVLPVQTRQLRDALTAQGSRVEMELYEGSGHADTVAAFSLFKREQSPLFERVIRFIGKVTRSDAKLP